MTQVVSQDSCHEIAIAAEWLGSPCTHAITYVGKEHALTVRRGISSRIIPSQQNRLAGVCVGRVSQRDVGIERPTVHARFWRNRRVPKGRARLQGVPAV